MPFPNKWDIPGGRIEEGETPDIAVRREMKEELGLDNLNAIKIFRIYESEYLNDFIFWKKLELNTDKITLNERQNSIL
ncbi:MAG: NUDIX domain-containing protein [Ignavibacterium sp.]|uniref:NUDIX domain-containing protein n=1 Tax=Ignavibacterium sp. TaxID=2651167 RepID=UPI00404ABB71